MAQLVAIRLLTRGPNANHKKGEVIEVDPSRAAALVARGHAEEVKDKDGKAGL